MTETLMLIILLGTLIFGYFYAIKPFRKALAEASEKTRNKVYRELGGITILMGIVATLVNTFFNLTTSCQNTWKAHLFSVSVSLLVTLLGFYLFKKGTPTSQEETEEETENDSKDTPLPPEK